MGQSVVAGGQRGIGTHAERDAGQARTAVPEPAVGLRRTRSRTSEDARMGSPSCSMLRSSRRSHCSSKGVIVNRFRFVGVLAAAAVAAVAVAPPSPSPPSRRRSRRPSPARPSSRSTARPRTSPPSAAGPARCSARARSPPRARAHSPIPARSSAASPTISGHRRQDQLQDPARRRQRLHRRGGATPSRSSAARPSPAAPSSTRGRRARSSSPAPSTRAPGTTRSSSPAC